VPDEQTTTTKPSMPDWWTSQTSLPERPKHPHRRRVMAIVAGVVAIGLIVGLLVFQIQRSRYHTIEGALDVGSIKYNSQCRLAPIYHGIHEGTPVVVKDTHGAVIGTSTLGPGAGVGPFCEFLFAVQVPTRDLYSIEVDHRGSIVYSIAYFGLFHWQAGLALSGAKIGWL
jgi:hypothetical protein